jgi:hypothetical protein
VDFALILAGQRGRAADAEFPLKLQLSLHSLLKASNSPSGAMNPIKTIRRASGILAKPI